MRTLTELYELVDAEQSAYTALVRARRDGETAAKVRAAYERWGAALEQRNVALRQYFSLAPDASVGAALTEVLLSRVSESKPRRRKTSR